MGSGTTTGSTAFENCDVSNEVRSVAVAVTTVPAATAGRLAVNAALPIPSVVTFVNPRNVAPSPKPEGSGAGLLKNSMRKVRSGVLLSTPSTVVPTTTVADDS